MACNNLADAQIEQANPPYDADGSPSEPLTQLWLLSIAKPITTRSVPAIMIDVLLIALLQYVSIAVATTVLLRMWKPLSNLAKLFPYDAAAYHSRCEIWRPAFHRALSRNTRPNKPRLQQHARFSVQSLVAVSSSPRRRSLTLWVIARPATGIRAQYVGRQSIKAMNAPQTQSMKRCSN